MAKKKKKKCNFTNIHGISKKKKKWQNEYREENQKRQMKPVANEKKKESINKIQSFVEELHSDRMVGVYFYILRVLNDKRKRKWLNVLQSFASIGFMQHK